MRLGCGYHIHWLDLQWVTPLENPWFMIDINTALLVAFKEIHLAITELLSFLFISFLDRNKKISSLKNGLGWAVYQMLYDKDVMGKNSPLITVIFSFGFIQFFKANASCSFSLTVLIYLGCREVFAFKAFVTRQNLSQLKIKWLQSSTYIRTKIWIRGKALFLFCCWCENGSSFVISVQVFLRTIILHATICNAVMLKS